MSLTVLNIVDDVSAEIRGVLTDSGGDLALITRWVDQIQKDLLHTSAYRHLVSAVESISTSANTTNYAMSTTTLRRVELVYDRTFQNVLQPIDDIISPMPAGYPNIENAPAQPGPAVQEIRPKTSGQFPAYYKVQTVVAAGTPTTTLYIFPAPSGSAFAGTIDVHYRKQVTTVVNSGDILTIPEDARDIIIAGVAYRASMYLKRPEDATMWLQIYNQAKNVEL